MHQADGSTLTLAADGTLLQISLPDDVQAVHQEDDTWQATAADGTVTTYAVSGTPVERVLAQGAGTIAYASDGSSVETTGDGTRMYMRPNMILGQKTSPDGVVTLCDNLGRPETVTRSATDVDHYQYNSDATVRVVNSATGEERILSSTGSLIRLITSDRHITTYDAQGRRSLEVTPEAAWTHFTYAADGSSTGSRSNGTIDSYDTNGRLFHSLLTNGATIDYPTDPAIQSVTTWLSGQVRTAYSDGTIQVYALGYTAICATDETWTATGANSAAVPVEAGADGTLRIQGTDEWVEIQPMGPVSDFASDGTTRIFTLGMDGSRTDFGSGQARTVTRPDSSQDVYDVHGNRIRHRDTSGVTTVSNPDRSTATLGSDGQVQAIKMKDGTDAAFDSTDGCWKHVASDGTTTRFNSNGSLYSVETADGGVRTFGTNGHSLLMRPDSAIEEADEVYPGYRVLLSVSYPGGSVETPLRDGSLRHVDTSGSLLGIRTADGTAAAQTESGEWTATDAQGTTTCYSSTGDLLSSTSPDDTTMDYGSDGTMVTHYADGSTLTENTDWSQTLVRADGSRLETLVDYTTIATDVHGTATRTNTDGTQIVTLSNGTATTIDANSEMRTVLLDGSVVRMTGTGALWRKADASSDEIPHLDSNGLTINQAEGTTLQWQGGALRISYADGTWQEFRAGGVRLSKNAAGDVTITHGTGVIETDAASGTTTFALPNGTVVTTSTDGAVTTTLADGSLVTREGQLSAPTVSTPAGTTSTIESDLTVVLHAQDGTVTRVNPNGFTEIRWPSGFTLSYSATGNVTVINADGTQSTTRADGSWTSTSAAGTTTTRADGAVLTPTRGTLIGTANYAAGRTVVTYGSAATIDYQTDGTLAASFADGSSIMRDSQGNLHVHQVNSTNPSLVSDGVGGWTSTLDWKTSTYTTHPYDDTAVVDYDTTRDPSYKPLIVHWLSSGDVTLEQPYGATMTYQRDGSTLLRNPDGSSILTRIDGTTVQRNTDGSWSETLADGTCLLASINGDITITSTEGTRVTWQQNEVTTQLGDSTTVVGADGTVRLLDAAGYRITTPDGMKYEKTADGHEQYETPDGVKIVRTVDSSGTPSFSLDAASVQASALTATSIGEDGTIVVHLSDQTLRFLADGTAETVMQDGSTSVTQPDGSVIYSKEGVTLTYPGSGGFQYQDPQITVTIDSAGQVIRMVGDTGSADVAFNGVMTQHVGGNTIVTTPNGLTLVNGTCQQALLSDNQGVRPLPMSVLSYSINDPYGADLAAHAAQGYKFVTGYYQTDPATGKANFVPDAYSNNMHLTGDPWEQFADPIMDALGNLIPGAWTIKQGYQVINSETSLVADMINEGKRILMALPWPSDPVPMPPEDESWRQYLGVRGGVAGIYSGPDRILREQFGDWFSDPRTWSPRAWQYTKASGELALGLTMAISGFTGKVAGTGVSFTGGGALVGIPAVIASASLEAAGAALFAKGMKDWANIDWEADYPLGQEPRPTLPSNTAQNAEVNRIAREMKMTDAQRDALGDLVHLEKQGTPDKLLPHGRLRQLAEEVMAKWKDSMNY